jgi:hypothetical protein
MRRALVVAGILGLVAGSLAAPVQARAKRAKPVKTTLYMHGNAPVGDLTELYFNVGEGKVMAMEPYPKSFSYQQVIANDECTGNPLTPSWQGDVSGTIVGDIKWVTHLLAPPSRVTARLWVDIPFASCTSSNTGAENFRPPDAEATVDVPPGHNEVKIVFKGVKKLKVQGTMIVQLIELQPNNQGRVFYDSPDFPTRLQFSCVPARGKSC